MTTRSHNDRPNAGSAPASAAGPPPGTSWRQLDAPAIATALGVSIEAGLTDADARARLARHGPNALPRERPPSKLDVLWRQFKNFIVLLLVAAAALSFLLGEVGDGGAIVAVLAVNAAIGWVMEYRAESEIAALGALTETRARVRRGGRVLDLAAEQLVPGDVVLLEPGDRLPADGRLVSGELHVDESLLTGESVPVGKVPDALEGADAPLAERRNEVFAGALVVGGTGCVIVTATGLGTEIGRLGRLIATAVRPDAPIADRLEALGRTLVGMVAAVAAILLAIGALQGRPFAQLLEVTVVLAIAAIPEGMPVVATLALAAGARRLTRRGLLLRRLSALEALGSVTTACLDKTGTLTENAMTVQRVATDALDARVTGVGWAPVGEFRSGETPLGPAAIAPLRALLRATQLCNDATLERHGGDWHIHGDPSEGAMLVAAAKAGLDDPRPAVRRLTVLPPGAGRPWMLVVCREGDQDTAYIKGAPDQVLPRCAPTPAAEAARAAAEAMGGQALRVFGVAHKPLAPGWGPEALEGGWSWLGLVGMADPPRPGAREALGELHAAGIRTVMLTGDHPRTATAVARTLALTPGREPRVTTDAREPEADVYARITPEDKFDLVRALESKGEVVAMTGDGVNDAPALRTATVGVAMGQGVEVAKEAAAAVLLDPRLQTLVAGVKEGRGAYFNIQKALDYLLTCSVATMLTVLLTTVAGFPLPLAPLQILYLNLLTHSLPALGLALEPPEPGVMARGPLPRRSALLSSSRLGAMLWHALMIATATLAVGAWGLAHESETHGRTLVFATLATALMLHALGDRSPRPFGGWRARGGAGFWGFLAAAIALQGLAIYWPGLASALSLTAIRPDDWLAVLLAAGAATFGVEISKRSLPPDGRPMG